MPDPNRKYISATQVPALFDQSPYTTRWMLYHWMKSGLPLDVAETERMSWGNRLEDVIIYAACDELRLGYGKVGQEVKYMPNGPLCCTVDHYVVHPDYGEVIIQAKNVDGLIWRQQWDDEHAPPHIELQVQTEMIVMGADMAYIAALVGGNELKLYKRTINEETRSAILSEANQFLDDVKSGREPDAFGSPREVPGIDFLYPEVKPKKVLQSEDQNLFECAQDYLHFKDQESNARKLKNAALTKLKASAKDAEIFNIPGYEITVDKKTIEGGTYERKDYIKTSLKFRELRA